jgi:uncharacterized protein YndB with AHSA1/START domain
MPPSGVSAVVGASPDAVYRAFTDPESLIEWLPPGEMTGRIHSFDLRVGGGYRMSLFYPAGNRGKTTADEDLVSVRFVELTPPRRIVEAVRFHSDDPKLAGEMTITVTLAPVAGGTQVTMDFRDLPPGLSAQDNATGARLSLDQLVRRFSRRSDPGRKLA